MSDPRMPVGSSPALAQFAANLRFEDLPVAVIAHTKLSILDTIGVALAGSGIGEGCDEILAYVDKAGGSGDATVWSSGRCLPPALAALANAAHARALDYDDIIAFPQIHVAACVVPAAFAVAQTCAASVSGSRFIAAVAAGCEVQSRLAAALAPFFGDGLPTMLSSQVFGYFSAAAACGNLLGLDPEAMQSAFGLSLMQAAGTEEMVVHAAASVGKCLYAGFSNQGGVQSAMMASAGVLARGEPIDGSAGLFAAYYGGRYDPSAIAAQLGVDFLSLDRCFKAMPGTLVSHAFAEAALILMRDHDVRPDDIQRVRLHVGPWGQAMCEPSDLRRRPTSASAAMNSIPFVVAKAICNGRVGLEDFRQDERAQAETLALLTRIDHVVDRKLANLGGLEPGIAEFVLVDGRSVMMRIDVPRGHPSRPLSNDDAIAKFRENAGHAAHPMDQRQLDTLVERLMRLDEIDDVTAIIDIIAARGTQLREVAR